MTSLFKALKSRNLSQAANIISNGDPSKLKSEVEVFFQRDRIIIPHDADNSRFSRNTFIESISNEFKKASHHEIASLIEGMQDSIIIAEEVFDKIKQSLTLCDFSSNCIEAQFWGILRRIDSEFKYIEENTLRSFEEQLRNSPHINFSAPLAVSTPNGKIDPDEQISLIIDTATLALKMLCHNNNYYRQGVTVAPEFIEPTEDQIYQSGSINILAAAWHHIEEHSKSCLYFGSKITKRSEGDNIVYEFEKSDLAQALDVYSYVADIRLSDKLTQKVSLHNRNIEGGFKEILEEILCIKLKESTEEYNGLTLDQIIKTYMALQNFTQASAINSSIILNRNKLTEIFTQAGIPLNKVDCSIDILLFGRTSDDLFDSPLIKINQEKYYLITPAVKFLNASRTTLSKIASLKHQIHSKGESFEQYTFDFLNNSGLNPIKMKFTEKNETYEYDVIFEFEGYIFILECKNVSLPGRGATGHLNYLNFIEETNEQVLRLHRGLVANKALVKDRFKIDIDNKQLVFVILNNLPYCIPSLMDNNMCISDFTSFTKPIIQSSINLVSMGGDERVIMPISKLRENAEILQPTDLINNLKKPRQFLFCKEKIMFQYYQTLIGLDAIIAYKIVTTIKSN